VVFAPNAGDGEMAELILEWQMDETGPREVRITDERPMAIGRLPANDIQVDHKTVSRAHARIAYRPDGFVIADLTGNRNLPRINDRAIAGETPLHAGDRIGLGDVTLHVTALRTDGPKASTVPSTETVIDTGPATDTVPIPDAIAIPEDLPSLDLSWKIGAIPATKTITAATPITIGRLPENAIQIDVETVSRTHVEIALRAGQFILTDLTKGRNAVTVNERRVEGERVLSRGDSIRLGTVKLTVTAVHRPGASGPPRPPGKGLVICPECLREVDASLAGCPWCSSVLDNAMTVMPPK
jgi:pSer/pThr/pTyr-binding forkhead associated (FHA) protein